MCLFAAYASLDHLFSFSKRHIPAVRRWMTQIIYKVGEAVGLGQVLAGHCPDEGEEQREHSSELEDGDSSWRNDANNTSRPDSHELGSGRNNDDLLRRQHSKFFSGRVQRQTKEHSERKGPESGTVEVTPTILKLHLLDERRRIALAQRAVNSTPY